MVLNNVVIAGSDEAVNIHTENGLITEVSSSIIDDPSLNLTFKDAIAFPGLINSHDHLDFNLFPKLGDRAYSNYTAWGKYIHKNYKAEIAEVVKIPVMLRAQWGLYKNLLGGVTTVVNHGERLKLGNNVITVFEKANFLHSVRFQKNWIVKLNNPLKKLPVNIHIGEGDDYSSWHEIDILTQWNLLRRKLIGVHAVAMTESQAKKFKAIVWCPESNFFLLNKTAPVNKLKKHSSILFGTDSTLTGDWNIWNHIKLARKTGLLYDDELYRSLNITVAEVWQLNTGAITPGKDADIIVARTKTKKGTYERFFDISPADLLLVMHKGNIRLFDEALLGQLKDVELNDFSKIYIDSTCKYVFGDLPGLITAIKTYNPSVQFPVSLTPPVANAESNDPH